MSTEPNSPREILATTAKHFPDHDGLHIPMTACSHYADTAITLDYRQLDQAVSTATTQWAASGINGRVALMLENRPDFFVQWLALNALGVSVIPLNHEMPDEEIPYYLEHGDAVAVCALAEHRGRLERICAQLPQSLPVVTPEAVATLNLATGIDPHSRHSGPDQECALLYTSGSTGKPKGCILSNDYFVEQAKWYANLDGLVQLREGVERLLTPLPLSHMNAMSVSAMAMFYTAGCLIQLDRFHPRSWWESVRSSGATALHYLGVLPAILLELPEAPDDDVGDQVRFGFGAGVNPKHHARFEQRFGFPLLEAWAMTECGAGGAIIANHEPRHVGECCFGRPPETLDWQLVDEQRQPVERSQPGELRVRAAGANPEKGYFSGYLKNPSATAEAWTDGWLNTGDIAAELPDGSLKFVDRRKNVIRRSGENISALEVEAALVEHPSISAVIVCPVPDDLRGDEVAACITLTEQAEHTLSRAEDIQRVALERLVYFKAPGWIVFCDSLPMTAANKPKRGDIKVLAREAIDSGAAFDLRSNKKRIK
ncbi:AMP-binding enzyme family protein [Luminiphilus syltensis NOR5-1B]|uniref:AMP-binding enzyme family protein n=1 Tax=Luminiphilus syltensis NOR5-1B TaxID=565045 RepID=B8KTB5_9GAMM|nr:AMP-binding protein [Luminiphilus syltensis]EED35064.1 AMP-binding enzyme family protein [Luminiphilus syltensis NOR5-1B]